MKYNVIKKQFSLIELLIVLSILAILISLLHPTLSKYQKVAQELHCQNNLSELQTGFIVFADDHNSFLPDSPVKGNYNDMNAFFLRNRLDWRPMANEYGFMAVTGNPVTGAKPWSDLGNTHNSWKRDSRHYYPKNNLNNYSVGVRSPTNLALATSQQVMFMDMLRINPAGGYYGIHGKGGELKSSGGSSSMTVYFDMAPEGCHTAFMDGATQWTDFSDLNFYKRGTFQHAYYPKK